MKFFLIFFILCFNFFSAQLGIRAIYHYKYINDTIKKRSVVQEMYLDLIKDNVKYYYQSFYETDSLQKIKGNSISRTIFNSQLIKRKLGGWENENFVFSKGKYFVIKSNDSLEWKILEETKNIKGYKVQKATTNFGGRQWIAWFCSAIPFQEGPYKFRGLPGLIFEIHDSKNYFLYELYKISTINKIVSTENFLETNFGKKPILITLNEYHKLLLDDYYNPFSDLFGSGTSGQNEFFFLGKTIKSSEDLKEILPMYQKHIRESYNPIELDKAIKYPNK